MRIQHGKPGIIRDSVSARVIDEIEEKIEAIATRYNCSKSFVIAVALAEQFGITKQEHYETKRVRVNSNSKTLRFKRRA